MVYFNERLAEEFGESNETIQKLRDLEHTHDMVKVTFESNFLIFGLEKTYINPCRPCYMWEEKYALYNSIVTIDGTIQTDGEKQRRKAKIEKAHHEFKKFESALKDRLRFISYIELEEIVDMLDRVRMKFIYDMDHKRRSDYFDSKRREREERKRKKREQLIKEEKSPHDRIPGQKYLSDIFRD